MIKYFTLMSHATDIDLPITFVPKLLPEIITIIQKLHAKK